MLRSRFGRWAIRSIAAAAAVVVLALVVLVCAGLSDQIAAADVALVLGNKVELDGRPSPRLQARLDRTLEVYRQHYFPRVIVSGGLGREGYNEAEVMKEYLVARGVPAEQVIVDSVGNMTFLSGRNTVEILRREKLQSVLFITQYFHVPRSRLILERLGISPVYSAHAKFFELRDVYSALRKVAGYAYYLVRPIA